MNYVITGTSRGIGLELTKQALAAGNIVHALARAPEKAKDLIQLKEEFPEKLFIYQADVTNSKQVSEFIKSLDPKMPVDVLINNAGVYGETASFENLSLDIVESTFANNSVAPMRVTRALLPWLQKSKDPKVIHITSLMGSISDNSGGAYYAYRMSKAALNMFNKSFSIDFPQITSIVVHPGWVKTDMGGKSAPLEPTDSAHGILALTDKSGKSQSGKFFDYSGKELPW